MIAKRLCLLLVLVALVSGQTRPTQAQNADTDYPLILRAVAATDGSTPQFYRYVDASWERLATGDIYDGSVSPTGEYLVFLMPPPFMADLLSEQGWQTSTAWDIALLNLQDGSRRAIAIHPDPIQISDDGNGYSGGIDRTVPVWSPDGQALVWTEQDYPAQSSARLLVYDLNSDAPRVLDAALPFMNLSSNGLPVTFAWDAGGIVVYTNDPADNAEVLRRYDAVNGLQQEVRLPPPETDFFWYPFLGPLWLTDATGNLTETALIVPAQRDSWLYEVNWVTGEVAAVTPRLEMMSAAQPDGSLRLLWSFYHMYMEPPEALLQLLTPDGKAVLSWDDFLGAEQPLTLKHFVIAPSGQTAAYLQAGALYLWQDGSVQEIALPPGVRGIGLQWGAARWQYATPYEPDAIG